MSSQFSKMSCYKMNEPTDNSLSPPKVYVNLIESLMGGISRNITMEVENIHAVWERMFLVKVDRKWEVQGHPQLCPGVCSRVSSL